MNYPEPRVDPPDPDDYQPQTQMTEDGRFRWRITCDCGYRSDRLSHTEALDDELAHRESHMIY